MAKKRAGRKGLAQTPAPKKERIRGSKTNKKGSASSNGARISFSDALTKKIKAFFSQIQQEQPEKRRLLFLRPRKSSEGVWERTAQRIAQQLRVVALIHDKRGELRVCTPLHVRSRGVQQQIGSVDSRAIKKAYTQDNDLM